MGVTARIRNQYIGCDEDPSHDSEGDFGNDCPILDILMNDGGVWFYDFRNEQEPEKKTTTRETPAKPRGFEQKSQNKKGSALLKNPWAQSSRDQVGTDVKQKQERRNETSPRVMSDVR